MPPRLWVGGARMLQRKDTIDQTRAGFAWDIPVRYNIGVDVCDRVAALTPDAPAIIGSRCCCPNRWKQPPPILRS